MYMYCTCICACILCPRETPIINQVIDDSREDYALSD